MANITSTHDVIVIGVGGMGSAACYHLAQKGLSVLGVEKYNIPHDMGSSHGETRIFRLTQPESSTLSHLARRASRLWEELDEDTTRDVLKRAGSINIGPEDEEYFQNCVRACEDEGIEYTRLSGEDVNRRFPAFDLPNHYAGVLQSDGGFLVTNDCILGHIEGAMQRGAEIHAREEVVQWNATRGGVKVKTNKQTYHAEKLVIAAGAWSSKLLGDLALPLSPERRVMGWFRPEKPEHFTPDRLPVFIVDGEPYHVYGFPAYDVPGFKVGVSPDSPEAVDPDRMDRTPKPSEEETLRRAAEDVFPGNVGPTLGMKTCIRTGSTDGLFYLGNHPEYPRVTIAAGFSGRGFKFCSVVGEIISDLVVRRETEFDIDPFRLDRV